MKKSNEIGDCRSLNQGLVGSGAESDLTPEEAAELYESCAHIQVEVWQNNYITTLADLRTDDVIVPVSSLGALALDEFYIPARTAAKDPTLTSWYGLTGEANRQKLADMFPLPTTWKDYCELVSTSNCTTGDDGVASRPPETEAENGKYFVEGQYTGYFRHTDLNNCTLTPECKGYFIDFP